MRLDGSISAAIGVQVAERSSSASESKRDESEEPKKTPSGAALAVVLSKILMSFSSLTVDRKEVSDDVAVLTKRSKLTGDGT